ncbi:fimbrial protein [Citrobacter cronae]|uniref:fimbrial protein n=1 Tax=Citrobacter cronae TaxID=1748967 RepID=UPI0021D2A6C4|nr:fimbrial protein [Citrobacter cronae]MCU6198648.1 fimbrial protein [Citrobacter cronae]
MSLFISRKTVYILFIFILIGVSLHATATKTKMLMLSMEVKAVTCTTAVVSDVNFNRQIASNLLAGKVSLPSELKIDCSKGGGAPDKITLRLQPASPHSDSIFSQAGYIWADGRTDIGYRLTWKDNQIGVIDGGVPMNTDLILKKPQPGNNNIGFNITAISPHGTPPAAGNASTSITIKISYS